MLYNKLTDIKIINNYQLLKSITEIKFPNKLVLENSVIEHIHDENVIMYKYNDDIFIHKSISNLVKYLFDEKYYEETNKFMDLIEQKNNLINSSNDIEIEKLSKEIETINNTSKFIIKFTNIKDKLYRLSQSKNNISTDEEYIEISNPSKVMRLLKVYSKLHSFPGFKWIDKGIYEIINFKEIKGVLRKISIQEQVKNYNINEITKRYVERHKSSSRNFLPTMFEFYCSKISGCYVYKYNLNELIGLDRRDIGVDLINMDNKKLVQCKYYRKSILSNTNLLSFNKLCQSFPTFKYVLMMNEDCKLQNGFDDSKFEIIKVSNEDFMKFVYEFVPNYVETKFESKYPMIKPTPKTAIPNTEPQFVFQRKFPENTIKTEIDLSNNVDVRYKLRKYKNIEVSQRISDGFINLSALVKFLNNHYGMGILLYKYLTSKDFYSKLILIDNSITAKRNIYLLYIPEENCFKIGRNFEISKDSNEIIEKNLIDILPVGNDKDAEEELIEYFSFKYRTIEGTKGKFKLTCKIETIYSYFHKIAYKYVIKPENWESKLISYPPKTLNNRSIFGHVEIVKLFIDRFVPKNGIEDWNYLFTKISHEIPNHTIDTINDVNCKTVYLYWYFGGCTIIKDMKTNLYNISKFINTLSDVGRRPDKTFIHLLRNKSFQQLIDEIRKEHGIEPCIPIKSNQLVLSGWWVHEKLLECVLDWLKFPDSKIIMKLNNKFTTTLKNNDLSSDEKIKQIQDLLKLTIFNKVGGKTSILSEDKFDEKELFHNPEFISRLEIKNNNNLLFIQ